MTPLQIVALTAAVSAIVAGQANVRGINGSGAYPVQPIRQQPTVVWEARPGFRDFGAMAAAGGVVVTGNITGSGGVFGFDTAAGKRLWSYAAGQMKGEPAIDGNAVFVVTMVGGATFRLSKLDLKTGKKLWSVDELDLGIHDGGPVVDAGQVYLISVNGKVQAFDAASGTTIWQHAYSPGKGKCPTAMSVAGGALYFGGGDSMGHGSQGRFLWALEARTGRQLWRFQAKPQTYSRDGECVSAPAVAGGSVIVTSEHVLYALDARTGALRWQAEAVRVIDGTPKRQYLSEPVIAGGTVYSSTKNGLSGWDLGSGRVVFDLPGDFLSYPSVSRMAAAGNVLYLFSNLPGSDLTQTGHMPLCAVDLLTKQVLWKHRVGRPSRYKSQESWPSHYMLPVDGAVYYENNSILVKIQ